MISCNNNTNCGKRIGSLVMVCALSATLAFQTIPTVVASEAAYKRVAQLRTQQSELQAQQDSYETQLAKLRKDKKSAVKTYQLLEQQNNAIANEIDTTRALIEEYGVQIAETAKELEETEQRRDEQMKRYCERTKQMEQGGIVLAWEAVFDARSLTDWLTAIQDMRKILAYDSSVKAELETLEAQVKEKKTQLEAEQSKQQQVLSQLEAEQADLQANEQAASEMMQEIQQNIDLYEEELNAIVVEQKDLEQDILRAETEAAKKAAEEKAQREKEAAEKAKRERLAAEKAERERLAAEKAEKERLAAEKAERERLAAEEAERERLAAEEAERERLAAEKAKQEKQTQSKTAEPVQPKQSQETAEVKKTKETQVSKEDTQQLKSETKTESQVHDQRSSEQTQSTVQTVTEAPVKQSKGVKGQDIVDFALQYVGGPYKWGGESLTEGSDCSGFVKAVYANFGYSLPHFSGSLRFCGKEVQQDDMKLGDIVCYNGHVGIYCGKNAEGKDQMVNAFNSKEGIIICSINRAKVLAVRRIVE